MIIDVKQCTTLEQFIPLKKEEDDQKAVSVENFQKTKISKEVYAKLMPIVAHSLAVDAIPDNLKEDIIKARIQSVNDPDFMEKATDVEVMAYIMTATFAAPLTEDVANVYFYLFKKWLNGKKIKVFDFIDDPRYDKLDLQEQELLNKLRRDIRRTQIMKVKARFKELSKKQQKTLS